MTQIPLVPPTDAQLLSYALYKAESTQSIASELAGVALARVEAGELPRDESTRIAVTNAIDTLKLAAENLPALIARLQAIERTITDTPATSDEETTPP